MATDNEVQVVVEGGPVSTGLMIGTGNQSKTYVPLRTIAEGLGASVSYDRDLNIVTIRKAVPTHSFSKKRFMGDKDVLRGLPGVHVHITTPDLTSPEINIAYKGVTKDSILIEAELHLRKLGIPVLTEDEYIRLPSAAILDVSLNILKPADRNFYAYDVDLTISELIYPEGQDSAMSADVWHRGSLGIVGVDAVSGISDNMGHLLDDFANDYLAANPKASAVPKPAKAASKLPPSVRITHE